MSLVVKLRRGEGPFWGTLKCLIKSAFRFHLPVVAGNPARVVKQLEPPS
jgi:hypothetical protein